MQLVGIFHILKECQHFSKFVHSIGREPLGIVFHVEAFNPFVNNVPDLHKTSVAC